jgi:hypothetical protein
VLKLVALLPPYFENHLVLLLGFLPQFSQLGDRQPPVGNLFIFGGVFVAELVPPLEVLFVAELVPPGKEVFVADLDPPGKEVFVADLGPLEEVFVGESGPLEVFVAESKPSL